MSDRLQQSYLNAQRQYDAQLPPSCESLGMKECPACEGDGKVMDDGAPDAVPVTCQTCDGEGEVEKTGEDVQDELGAKADCQREADIDRQMGL